MEKAGLESIKTTKKKCGHLAIYSLSERSPAPHLGISNGGGLILGLHHDVEPVKDDVLDAAAEVLLVAEEDLVKVSHAAHKDAVVNVQLVESARQLSSGDHRDN